MAEGVSSSITIDPVLLQCSMCLEQYQDPRSLPCQHGFCLRCLEDYVKVKVRSSKAKVKVTAFPCPLCKNNTPIPPAGVRGFPAHFFINSLLQQAARRPDRPGEHLNKDVDTSSILDIPAPDGSNSCGCGEVHALCKTCPWWCCQQCSKVHRHIPATSNHEVVSVEDIQEQFRTIASKWKIRAQSVRSKMESRLGVVNNHLEDVLAKASDTEASINATADAFSSVIEESRKGLIKETKEFFEPTIRKLLDWTSTAEEDIQILNMQDVMLDSITTSRSVVDSRNTIVSVADFINKQCEVLDSAKSVSEISGHDHKGKYAALKFSPSQQELLQLTSVGLGSLSSVKLTSFVGHGASNAVNGAAASGGGAGIARLTQAKGVTGVRQSGGKSYYFTTENRSSTSLSAAAVFCFILLWFVFFFLPEQHNLIFLLVFFQQRK